MNGLGRYAGRVTDRFRKARTVAELAREDRLASAAFALSTFAYPNLDLDAYDDRLTQMAGRIVGGGPNSIGGEG